MQHITTLAGVPARIYACSDKLLRITIPKAAPDAALRIAGFFRGRAVVDTQVGTHGATLFVRML
jgi:hypothetical protein